MAKSSTDGILVDPPETLETTTDTTNHGCQIELTETLGNVHPDDSDSANLKTFVDTGSTPQAYRKHD
ncbi:hypothetical protein N7494_004913 [Penicillium frequentans]|uniref:Uncharacterized protein n=1 Tax=Penicillium frequentans TaxID=3151616 RepID=A0AAD6D3Y7_9EURO|nr:hypothetical protein N7494_004913 [Penicillium glabrum]